MSRSVTATALKESERKGLVHFLELLLERLPYSGHLSYSLISAHLYFPLPNSYSKNFTFRLRGYGHDTQDILKKKKKKSFKNKQLLPQMLQSFVHNPCKQISKSSIYSSYYQLRCFEAQVLSHVFEVELGWITKYLPGYKIYRCKIKLGV